MRIRKHRWSKIFRLSGMFAATSFMAIGQSMSAQAGPFSDMWSNGSGNAYAGYPNTSYSPILPAGVPQSQVGILPTGAYASQYYKVPTTYYRPVTTFDPRLGTTVTSLQPCTSYQYQAQRVPLLVPETHSTAAYGSYGVSPQTRYAPILNNNTNAGASGQSTLSIPSGLGSQYTAPVVQMPNSGVPLFTQTPSQVPQTQFMPQTQLIPQAQFGTTAPYFAAPIAQQSFATQPVTNGYGGVHYGPTVGIQNQGFNTTVTSPVATSVVPAAAWTTTTTNGGYIGNAPQQFSQPALVTQTPTQQPTAGSMSAPQYGPGATITPLGPPVITAVPANQNGVTYSQVPSQATSPVTSQTFGPMPGSMGSSVMPNAVYPTNPPSLRDTESSVAPSLPPTTLKPILPPDFNTTSKPQWTPEVMPSDVLPNSASEPNRFQLRRVERDLVEPSTDIQNRLPTNPFDAQTTPQTLNKPSMESGFAPHNPGSSGGTPGLMQTPSLDQPAINKPLLDKPLLDKPLQRDATPNLEMKLESLKPIPAPPSFDASPAWRPVLLTPRDQTAGLPDRMPSTSLSASHQYTSIKQPDISPSRSPAPKEPRSMSLEEELNSNLVFFKSPTSASKP